MSLPAPFLRMGVWVTSWSTNWPKLITRRVLLWSGLSRSLASNSIWLGPWLVVSLVWLWWTPRYMQGEPLKIRRCISSPCQPCRNKTGRREFSSRAARLKKSSECKHHSQYLFWKTPPFKSNISNQSVLWLFSGCTHIERERLRDFSLKCSTLVGFFRAATPAHHPLKSQRPYIEFHQKLAAFRPASISVETMTQEA